MKKYTIVLNNCAKLNPSIDRMFEMTCDARDDKLLWESMLRKSHCMCALPAEQKIFVLLIGQNDLCNMTLCNFLDLWYQMSI